MSRLIFAGAALVAIACVSLARPAAADGEILLTHTRRSPATSRLATRPAIPSLSQFPFEVASNLFVAAGKTGIQVASHNVTIDLNGFALQGTNVAFHGIAGAVRNVTVRNGTVDDFKFDGIVAGGLHWKIESMRIVSNGRHGIA